MEKILVYDGEGRPHFEGKFTIILKSCKKLSSLLLRFFWFTCILPFVGGGGIDNKKTTYEKE